MMFEPDKVLRLAAARLKQFVAGRRGNVAVIVCVVAVPLIFAVGMGVDYTEATRRQDQINGFADAAALAAVTPNEMTQSSTAAASAAQSVFLSQLATMTGINYSASNVAVTATDTATGTTVSRLIKISYSATSTNNFSSVLGVPNIAIGGNAQAVSSVAPNINFYMLLDTSPSMGIAATPAGIATMVANTAPQGGCAFACHETYPAGDNLQNPSKVTCTSPSFIQSSPNPNFPHGGEDNFTLARCLNVTLRIDNVSSATYSLMNTASTTAAANNTSYGAAMYTMDYSLTKLIGMTPITSGGNLTALQNKASGIQAVTVYDNSCLTSSNCNNDQDSALDQAIQQMYGIMPLPGNGTNSNGDTPQEVLFIVSDGLNDENYGGRQIKPINTILTNPDYCTKVKSTGVRIAFLYLTYYPLPTNSFYVSNVAPYQTPTDQLAAAAQSCASPGLYFAVDTGGDITAAMTALFQKVIATAHLTQ